jgi:hypothetical protein
MIGNIRKVLRAHRANNMVLRSEIITSDNLDAARWTSEIAMNDARPCVYAGDASRTSPWEDLQRLGFVDLDDSEENELRSTCFTDRVVPHDVSHWRTWSGHIWTDRVPQLRAPNQIKPAVLSLNIPDAAKAIIQYRRYEASFERWAEDVVAYLAYQSMREAAEMVSWFEKHISAVLTRSQGNTATMSHIYRIVKHMMSGGRVSNLANDDEEEERDESETDEIEESESEVWLVANHCQPCRFIRTYGRRLAEPQRLPIIGNLSCGSLQYSCIEDRKNKSSEPWQKQTRIISHQS